MNNVNFSPVESSPNSCDENESDLDDHETATPQNLKKYENISENSSLSVLWEDNLDAFYWNEFKKGSQRQLFLNNFQDSSTAVSAIQEFVETLIVLRKDKNNQLGISITGGSDTYLELVCVTEVHLNGAAYKDGRLKKGDIILGVNEISFREICRKDAVKVIKDSESPLKLLVLRENPQKLFTTSHDSTKFITVQLKKGSIKDKLGISLIQRINGRGVFITYVQPGGIASRQGHKIMQGDQILEINGISLRESNQKDVAALINSLDGEIVLLLGRNQTHSNLIQEWIRKKSQVHWQNRTSTWSAYGGVKDKVPNQRPSLPTTNDQFHFLKPDSSPDQEIKDLCNNQRILSNLTPKSINLSKSLPNVRSEENYRKLSQTLIKSKHRLSIVVESTKSENQDKNNQISQSLSSSKGFPLVPSIQITEF